MTAPLVVMRAKAILVVIPTLNEAAHISGLLKQILTNAKDLPLRIVVADGGSEDGTLEQVEAIARQEARVDLMHNPQRIQSAGINRAVELYGEEADLLIRIDAHSVYPADYCRQLVREAEATGADSVVVGMRTVGLGCFQRAVAAAQNARLGNGGSSHRRDASAAYVDHGHHALMRMAAFRRLGGYDETFTHNEDAEFDARLTASGGRLWLTDKVRPIYFPRSTAGELFRQYRRYGRGRARTHVKHRKPLKLRQIILVMVAPSSLAAVVAPLAIALGLPWLGALMALPALLWLAASLGYGAVLGLVQHEPCVLLSGPAAVVMHFAWSLGFVEGLFGIGRR
ncbi:glycosyltransferase family 2 protein [Acuticoccus sp.]|uniref:glycosyltransferase family 2 protein n=1 Tax=Acuticoccus sp. TaxID=1904378 RepID=UPI003B517314